MRRKKDCSVQKLEATLPVKKTYLLESQKKAAIERYCNWLQGRETRSIDWSQAPLYRWYQAVSHGRKLYSRREQTPSEEPETEEDAPLIDMRARIRHLNGEG